MSTNQRHSASEDAPKPAAQEAFGSEHPEIQRLRAENAQLLERIRQVQEETQPYKDLQAELRHGKH